MRFSYSRNRWLLLLIAILGITGLAFRVHQTPLHFELNDFWSFINHTQFVSGSLIISGLFFLLAALFSHFIIRLRSLLLPILLLVCVVLNMLSFNDINKSDIWKLERLPTNNLVDLLQASHDQLYTRIVYVLFETHFKGRNLILSPGLLEDVGLSPELLKSWGCLAEVRMLKYDANLSELEVFELLHLEHIKLEIDGGDRFIFITESSDSSVPLLITRNNRRVFIVPLNLLPNRELNP